MQTQVYPYSQGFQSNSVQNEILLPYYLQQHEITKTQFTNFTQIANTAESLQMTMNPYLGVNHP